MRCFFFGLPSSFVEEQETAMTSTKSKDEKRKMEEAMRSLLEVIDV